MMVNKSIQLFTPHFQIEECLAEIRVCLEKGWTGIGFKTNDFEKLFSEYTGQKYCHFLNSNTNGSHLLLEMLKKTKGWADGDDIISTAITFVSTNHSILNARLNPVFADVDDSLCMTPANVRASITSKTRAVIFVGIGGNSGCIEEIANICKEKGLVFIYDAAHSAGSKLNGRDLSFYADYTVYSFQAVKNLPTADSGLITVKTEEEDKLVRQLSWCGINKDTFSRSKDGYKWLYSVDDVGYKYNGNSIMAAIAIVQLRYLDEGNARRRTLAAMYQSKISKIPRLHYISHANEHESSRHLVQLLLPNSKFRNDLIEYLDQNGIGSGVHYRSNSRYPMYANNTTPYSNEIDEKIISLPCHLNLSDEDVGYVVEKISDFAKLN
jgi:dTDP-4-amino-4,6-dideoxygalactose transaminase